MALTLNVLKMMRNDIYHFEFERFFTPVLTDSCATLSIFLSSAINCMEDRHAGEIRMANRATVAVKVVERRIDYHLKISSKCFHPQEFILDNRFYQY